MHRSVFTIALLALWATGCLGARTQMQRENRRLRAEVAELRAEARQDRNTIRDLKNQVFLLEDRADTAEVQRDRAPGQDPELPVEVVEPEAPRSEEAGGAYEVVGVSDDGSEIVYVGDAADDRTVRADLSMLGDDEPRRSRPERRERSEARRSRERSEAVPPAPESDERLPVTDDVPAVGAAVRTERPASPAGESPREQYKRYYTALRAGNHGYAIAGFGNFLERYPGHDYADNAQYWLAEAYYDQKEYRTAITEFRKVVVEYPGGNKVPDAMLKIGFCHLARGNSDEARDVLEQVVRVYPESNPAQLAARKLEGMSKE